MIEDKQMLVTKSYVFEKTLSKKDFLLKVIDRLKTEDLPYDIFSLGFSEVREETRSAFLVTGSGEFDYSCSVGNDQFDYGTGNRILQYRPLSGKVSGRASGLVCCYKPIELSRQEAILQAVHAMTPTTVDYEMTRDELENCKENLKSIIFDSNFKAPGSYVQGLSYSGSATIESVSLVEVPYYTCSFFYKEFEVKVVGMALEDVPPSFRDLDKLPKKAKEEAELPKIAEKNSHTDKRLSYIMIVPALAAFYTLPMFFNNLGKDVKIALLYLVIFAVALTCLAIFGYHILNKKRLAYKAMEKKKQEYAATKQRLMIELIDRVNSL